MADAVERIHVGVVGRAHGIRGAIRVFTDDAGSDSLLHVKAVYLGTEAEARRVLRATRCGRFVALELDGVDDRDKAFALTGLDVYIDRGALRPLRNAFYACDLVGLSIRDADGREWGTVAAVVPGSAHEILEYRRSAGGTGYMPFVAAHVGRVDLDAKTVEVDSAWMAALDAVYGE